VRLNVSILCLCDRKARIAGPGTNARRLGHSCLFFACSLEDRDTWSWLPCVPPRSSCDKINGKQAVVGRLLDVGLYPTLYSNRSGLLLNGRDGLVSPLRQYPPIIRDDSLLISTVKLRGLGQRPLVVTRAYVMNDNRDRRWWWWFLVSVTTE